LAETAARYDPETGMDGFIASLGSAPLEGHAGVEEVEAVGAETRRTR
jgi:hypothetical protein